MDAQDIEYITDVGYTTGYYSNLNPTRIYLPFLQRMIASPKIKTACELGFGQGLSINIHAASSSIEWFGTDFNSAHTKFAQKFAEASQANVNLYDDSFKDFSLRNDLPEFDYIGLHGIWSWISEENQNIITDFIFRKLKPGGVLSISYNTQPGWAVMSPIRELMMAYFDRIQPHGANSLHRVNNTVQFISNLIETKPNYFYSNPQLLKEFESIKKHKSSYLAHEYFNGSWTPMPFVQIANKLQKAKLDYLCSANYLNTIDHIQLTKEQRKFIATIPDPVLKENISDFCTNSRFRKDYWVKGAINISKNEQIACLRSLRFILTVSKNDVAMEMNTPLGKITLSEKIYKPLLECFSDYQIKSFAKLEHSLQKENINFNQLLEALIILSGREYIAPVQDDKSIAGSEKTSMQLNKSLLSQARSAKGLTYLSSCITGGGVQVDRINQLFVLSLLEKCNSAKESASYAWKTLSVLNQKLMKDGKAVESEDENKKQLATLAETFYRETLPRLKALKIV